MALLKEEELRERDRLSDLEDTVLSAEVRAGMQGRFNMERRQAHAKIEKLIR